MPIFIHKLSEYSPVRKNLLPDRQVAPLEPLVTEYVREDLILMRNSRGI